MRFRTASATAALIVCTAVAGTACSSSDAASTTPPAGPAATTKPASVGETAHIETGRRQSGGPTMDGGHDSVGPAKCATSAAEIPEECALDPSFAKRTDGEPATESPVTSS
jgi:hypothetical protein